MDIYTTFSPESREMELARRHLLPLIAQVSQVSAPAHPIHLGNLIETLGHVHEAAAASTQEYLCVILTDLSGDGERLLELFSSMPPALGVQIITFDVTGARNLTRYHHLRSDQLIFMATAWDEETQQVLSQIKDSWGGEA